MAFTTPGYQFNPLTGMRTNKKQPWQTALGARSTGLNQQYGLGQFATPDGGGGKYPGQIDTPGYTPDYKSLISQALGPLNAQLGAEGSADAATRNAQLIRGIGQFGEQFDPASAQAAFGQDFYKQAGLEGILGQANQLAGETTKAGFSVSAKLKDALAKSVQQIQDSLAARGMLRSGATGVELQGAQKEYDTSQYDARQSLTDYLSSAQQGYVAGERARQSQLEAAGRQEAVNQATLNPATGTQQAQLAGTDPVTKQPFYRKKDGTLVDASGNPYAPTSAATPAAASDIAKNVPQQAMSQRTGGEAGGSAQLQAILAKLHSASQDQRLGF